MYFAVAARAQTATPMANPAALLEDGAAIETLASASLSS